MDELLEYEMPALRRISVFYPEVTSKNVRQSEINKRLIAELSMEYPGVTFKSMYKSPFGNAFGVLLEDEGENVPMHIIRAGPRALSELCKLLSEMIEEQPKS